MFKKHLLFWILIAIFLKQLAWVSFIPIFQTPDEQAHFGEVSYIAETNSIHLPAKNTSLEIVQTEKDLGVFRDSYGNNKYTYHPEFNIPYSKSPYGPKEKSLSSLPLSSRTSFQLNEATDYPRSYYLLGIIAYGIFNNGSIFDRLFAVRMLSIFSLVLLCWVAYKIGQLVFEDDVKSLALMVLVGFMPMLSFVHAGVTSDTLFNLLFTLFIWRCLLLIKNGITIKDLIYIALVVVFSFWTKPQANIMAFILIPLITIIFLTTHKNWKQLVFVLVAVGLSLLGIVYRLRAGVSFFPETDGLKHVNFSAPQVLEHLKFTMSHTYHEVLPWFWGVFRWLSLALPDPIRKLTNVLTVISVIGFGLFCLKQLIKKNFSQKFWMSVFLAFSVIVYFAAITAFDFGFRQAHGYSFGIQGRYFFPVIVPFLAIFLIGLNSFTPASIRKILMVSLAISMIVFNLFVYFYLLSSYYQLSFPEFFIQASQYKPVWLKYPINIIILTLFITSSVILVRKIAQINDE